MTVFAGTNRQNTTTVIENNQTMVVGAPVRVPISSGAVVVA